MVHRNPPTAGPIGAVGEDESLGGLTLLETGADSEQETASSVGIQQVLTNLVRAAVRESLDLVSLAVGDHQGLPIVSVTRGEVPAMTFTAMATMSLRAAKTAANAIGLDDPEHMAVHSPGGELLVMQVRGTRACLIALLKPEGNLGFAIRALRRLSEQVGEALAEE